MITIQIDITKTNSSVLEVFSSVAEDIHFASILGSDCSPLRAKLGIFYTDDWDADVYGEST